MNPAAPWRVVKLGGSLLDWTDLVTAWPAWYRSQAPRRTALVVGGGELAEAIRRADALFNLDERLAHQLCVEGMRLNALWVARLFSTPELWDGDPALRPAAQDDPLWIEPLWIDPVAWLAGHERRAEGQPLPYGWRVTSDSIAARLAEVLGAEELVLLKSCLPATGDPAGWARESLVDGHFTVAAASLSAIRVVNLRDGGFGEVRWRLTGDDRGTGG